MRVLRHWIRTTQIWHLSEYGRYPLTACGMYLGWETPLVTWRHETPPADGRVCNRCLAWLRRREEV